MDNEQTATGSRHQTSSDEHTKATSLEKAIHAMVLREERHHEFAEKATYVYAENGKVRIPRSNAYVETDQERLLFVGTDDYVFKDFIEGPLRGLFGAITSNQMRPCRPTKAPRGIGASHGPVFTVGKLAQRVITCCRLYKPEWAVAYMHHEFHPKVTVMLRAMQSHAEFISRHGEAMGDITRDAMLVQAIARLVRFVRRVSKNWKFINKLKAHERQAKDNFDSARRLIYHYAEEHSKLLILRIDLYFKPFFEVWRADDAIDNYLRWLRSDACKDDLLPGYLGFMIKRENGLVRGMHWHLLVVCKGNAQHSADYLTRQLGMEWARRTGQGPGSYHNCYADRRRHEFNGLGVIELDDWEMMAGLRAAIWYMTKQDCVIKATNDKVKNFWRSPIRKKAGKKLGRPRASADPLNLLQRMLGGERSKYPPGFCRGNQRLGPAGS